MWEKYAKGRYNAFNKMGGNLRENRVNFLSNSGTVHGNMSDRVGKMAGAIGGMPDRFTNKSAMTICGLVNTDNVELGIDVSKETKNAVSIFASIRNRMYADHVNANAQSITYIGEGGLSCHMDNAPVVSDQTLANLRNKAMVKTMDEATPVRVFTTDHQPDGLKNTIRFIGLYTVVDVHDRYVNVNGEVVPQGEGFKQFVFTLNRM